MYTNAIIPIAEKIAAKHTNFIAKNHFPDGSVRMRKDFSKIPALQNDLKDEATKDKLVMDGVAVVLNMPITSEAKNTLLVTEYGFSQDIADEVLQPAGSSNKTLEILKSLSPLLANKLLEKLSEEEVKGLLK